MITMIRKYQKLFALISAVVLILTGCSAPAQKNSVADKTYLYEKDGFGGDFTIQLKSDGTFSFYEGGLSSYIGTGEWKLEEEVLVLRDNTLEDHPFVNYFKVDGDDLIFISEKSTNFMYLDVLDGEKFSAS